MAPPLTLPALANPTIGMVEWLVTDIIAVLEGPVVPGGWTRADIGHHPGGSAANTAWSAATAGADVHFIGLAGADAQATDQIELMHDLGITTKIIRRGATRTVLCLVDQSGERHMIAGRGPLDMTPDDLDPAAFAGLGVLHISAYALLNSTFAPVVVRAVDQARAQGAAISLDVASFEHARRLATGPYAALAPDVTFSNIDESAVLFPPGTTIDFGLVVHKRGAHPTLLQGPGDLSEQVPVPPVTNVVDTTGAGDAMAGGFLAAWAAGATPRQAAQQGHAQSARVITQAGARVPSTPR